MNVSSVRLATSFAAKASVQSVSQQQSDRFNTSTLKNSYQTLNKSDEGGRGGTGTTGGGGN